MDILNKIYFDTAPSKARIAMRMTELFMNLIITSVNVSISITAVNLTSAHQIGWIFAMNCVLAVIASVVIICIF